MEILKPFANRVLVRRLDPITKSQGGILIPDTAQKKQPRGVIVAVGPGTEKEPMLVKKGMTVLFNDYGVAFVPDDRALCVVTQNDILCEVVDEKASQKCQHP